jgi:lipoprotein NlpI
MSRCQNYCYVLPIVLALAFAGVAWAETAEELLKAARAALMKRDADEALRLADRAVSLDAKNGKAFLLRGEAHEALQHHAEAVADFDKCVQLSPDLAEAYDHRGSEHFKLGHITESLRDFDKTLELEPTLRPDHWKRGITCYYAGKFDEGRKQFEGYEKVDTNDVENAVWHYLCVARLAGPEKARASILRIGKDKRVPMMQVYALYSGQARPEDVLAAVQEGKPRPEELNERLFYAHLYLGLYYEVTGDKKQALEHLKQAAEDHKIGHYMWDVAHVHLDLLRKETKP